MSRNADVARKLAVRVGEKALASASRGLDRARKFLEAKVKEAVSTPAPRKLVKPRDGSAPYYRATTPATPGAPPRMVSGNLRDKVTSRMDGPRRALVQSTARSRPSKAYPAGFPYGQFHERRMLGKARSGEHPYVKVTADRHRAELKSLISSEVIRGAV